MANVSFKKNSNKSANELPNEINEGTIYITKEQEMYLDIDSSSRVQIAGNIIYKDLDNVVNPDIDTELPPTFGGYTVNDFLLKTGGEMTGQLILNDDPTNDLGAATKQYVDNSAPKIYRVDYTANGNETRVEIPSNIQDYDNMMVYQNGLLLIKGANFEISGTDIAFIDYSLNPGETITFTGPLYANANLKGEPGQSATHQWDGTTLTITSASGTSSVDLKGDPGKDGADAVSPTITWDSTGSRLIINNNGAITYSDSLKMSYLTGPDDPPTGLSVGQLYFVYE